MISSKGYSILLDDIEKEDLAKLKSNLTVKPKVMADYDFGKDSSFPVYKLSNTRIYIPKFYGIKQFGKVEKNSEKEGKETFFNFNGELKQHQISFCDSVLNEIKTKGSCIGHSGTGTGKCHSINTPILMFDGSIKMVQDININDLLMGDDSTQRRVLSLGRGTDIMYEVLLSDGTSHTFNSEHILCIKSSSGNIYDISIANFIKLPEQLKSEFKLYRNSVDFPHKEVGIDPYNLGLFIGSDQKTKWNIHNDYKINSREIRLQTLNGIIDSSKGYFINENLIEDTIYLSRSLGFSIDIDFNINGCVKISIYPYSDLSFSIIEKSEDNYYGFELDGNHRYLLGDFLVTHNTAMSLYLMSKIQKKTLIVVHKNFLLDQWIERIKQFLPNSTIGIIRQDECDTSKDITIGMIQTILSRDYKLEDMGFSIYDETHHLAASTFSQVLFKCKTKYSLGLSATPHRKDGLTMVLEWFLGNIISNEVSSEIEKPHVEFLEADYSTDITPKFNFKGLLNSPDMVNQLVADPARNKLIISRIAEIYKTGRKILILSGRRNHCIKLSEMFNDLKIGTGSIYIGGMKNEELEKSNKSNAIFATYQSVSEGYDNPSLDTLLMATGMSDVTQSIGRILRRKNNFVPLIIDVIDIEFFGSQARRRKQYYKKNEFNIPGLKKTHVCEESMFE